jgi:hypothetical protein
MRADQLTAEGREEAAAIWREGAMTIRRIQLRVAALTGSTQATCSTGLGSAIQLSRTGCASSANAYATSQPTPSRNCWLARRGLLLLRPHSAW